MAASRRARLKGLATRATTSAAARLGLDVVPRGAYSPLARVPAAGDPSWERRLDLPGVRLALDAQAAFIADTLSEHVAAFAVPAPFRLDNPFYGPGDAELLFALLRHEPPLRILELGSGWSTHVARAAAPHADLVAVDPQPIDAVQLPLDRFAALEAGDVLFVDTSHVVKRGGEVTRVVLGVLPRLRKGVRASGRWTSSRTARGTCATSSTPSAPTATSSTRSRPTASTSASSPGPRPASVRPGTAPAPSRRPTGGAGRSGRG